MTNIQITPPADLEQSFAEYFEPFKKQALEWQQKAESIQVTDGSQSSLILAAREARLGLRGIRVAGEKKHKELKERALREGQAIDRVWRELKGLIEPIEEHLQKQEDFAEIQEKEKRLVIFNERALALQPYMGEEAKKMPLADLTQDVFDTMLAGYKAAVEKKKEDEVRAKKENDERERAAQIERDKLAEENKKLKEQEKRTMDRINYVTGLGLKWNEERQEYRFMFQGEATTYAASITRHDIETLDTLQFRNKCVEIKERVDSGNAEKVTMEKAAQDLRDKAAEAERVRQLEEANRIKAEKKAARAPDRVKLATLSSDLYSFPVPEVKSPEAQIIIKGMKDMLNKIGKYIDKQTEQL